MTKKPSPTIDDLFALTDARTTEQLIQDHAIADTYASGQTDHIEARVLVCAVIETILQRRGIPICNTCGTPAGNHSDFCR